jgi:hypothetical protein
MQFVFVFRLGAAPLRASSPSMSDAYASTVPLDHTRHFTGAPELRGRTELNADSSGRGYLPAALSMGM